MAQHNHWTIQAGDVSTAFLHAPAATDNLYMWPPPELYPSGHNTTTVWKLNKAIYGLRSSPKSWQDHFAQVLQQLGLTRLTSEPNVYRNKEQTMFVMVHVDDLLFLGQPQEVNKTFQEIQKHVLLRPTGTLGVGQTIQFLGRDIYNKGDHFELSLKPEYITALLKETKMETSNPAATPGTATLKQTTNDEAPLDKQEHADYRRAVGKLQRLTYTRPDFSFSTKELARDLQQPTQQSLRKLKHLLRYLRGTQQYKMIIRRTHTHTTNKGTHRPEYLRRCGLGRMPKHKKNNKRIHRDNDGIRRTIRQQNTSSGSTIIGRIRTIRNRNRGTRRPTHSQLHQGSNNDKSEHPHTHGQHKRKEHCSKNRFTKESKTYRPEVPIHTTTGTERNTINPQNQHTRQPSGHTHKVCPGRGAQQTPLQGGHSMPTTSQLTTVLTMFHNNKASPACTIHTRLHEPWYTIS